MRPGGDSQGGAAGTDSIVVLGRVTGAYGVRGWVRIQPSGDDPMAWGAIETWWIARTGSDTDSTKWQPYSLQQCRMHGHEIVACLKEVGDRTAAESLRGALFGVPRAELPEPEEGAYYWGDLIGMQVTGVAGAQLGKVERLIETGANDVLVVVDAEGRQRLLPFVDAVIRRVDRGRGEIEAVWDAEW